LVIITGNLPFSLSLYFGILGFPRYFSGFLLHPLIPAKNDFQFWSSTTNVCCAACDP